MVFIGQYASGYYIPLQKAFHYFVSKKCRETLILLSTFFLHNKFNVLMKIVDAMEKDFHVRNKLHKKISKCVISKDAINFINKEQAVLSLQLAWW